MKKMTRCVFSLILILILCFSSCPVSDIGISGLWTVEAAASQEDSIIISEHSVSLENTGNLMPQRVCFSSAESAAEYDGCFGNQLQGNARGIYDVLMTQYGINGEYEEYDIELPEPITFEMEVKNNTAVKNEAYNEAVHTVNVEFQNAVDAFFYDCAKIFWIKTGYYVYYVEAEGSKEEGYTGIIDTVTYYPMAFHTDKISDYDDALNKAVSEIKGMIKDTSDRYEVVKAIHDYVCNNSYYKLSADYIVHQSYPFFLGDGGMVCDGYARTFKVLCDAFDIECACIGGYAYNSDGGEGHMWNYVKMENEKWYLVDTTWDDGKVINYTYFLASANAQGFYAPLSEERYEINTFSEAGYTKFVYPELSTSAFKRHYHSWESDYTTDKEPSCTEKGIKSIHCSTCDSVKSKEEIATKGHKYVLTGQTEATYSKKATETYTCSLCRKVKVKALDYKKLEKATSLKTSSVTDDSVKLSWKKVEGAEAYEVYYKYSGGNWRNISTTKNSVKINGMKAGKRYAFRVVAAAGENLSEYSNTVKCTTCPDKVKRISSVQSASAIKLTWQEVEGADGYRLYMYNTKSKKWEKVVTTDSKSYKVKNLDSATVYKFRVKAYIKADGKTLWGEASETYKTATKPDKVKLSTLTAKKSCFVAKWKEVENSSGYLVEYSAKKDFSKKEKILVKGSDSLKKTVKGLKSGKTYYVRVRAYKTVDGSRIYGGVSSVKKVTVK